MIWLCVFWAFAQELVSGHKLLIHPSFGSAISGWFVDASKECVFLSSPDGPKAVPVPLIKVVEINKNPIGAEKFKEMVLIYRAKQDQRPKVNPNNAFAMGLFNTGLPFIYLKQPHGPILAIADVGILVGGGVSAYRRNPTAVPLFLGLIGLRLWAAVEAKSLASSFQRQPPKDCL